MKATKLVPVINDDVLRKIGKNPVRGDWKSCFASSRFIRFLKSYFASNIYRVGKILLLNYDLHILKL